MYCCRRVWQEPSSVAPNVALMSLIVSIPIRVPTTVGVAGQGGLEIAAELFIPPLANLSDRSWLWVCLPGGGMNRRFFDLQPGSGDDSFSLARFLVGQGQLVLLIDHAGIGESTRPDDGYVLVPEVVAAANAETTQTILSQLRHGSLTSDLPPLPNLCSIGLGHSMGAMMTVIQQARYAQHHALVVLGFGTDGLPKFLSAEARELATHVEAVRAALPELARKMFVQPYPRITRIPKSVGEDLYGSETVDPQGVQALKAALDPILPVPSFMAMLPGNVAPEAAQITVPVFIGVGDRDMMGPPHRLPTNYPASLDVTLQVLPATGHSHFIFPTRLQLFKRLLAWANSLHSVLN